MSHPPRKPLFWHALFVHKTAGMLCLKVFVCLWLTASGCEMRRAGNQTHESAHHIPHSLDTRDAPGSSPPRKPLRLHAFFALVCMSAVYCVLLRSVWHIPQQRESAHQNTAAFYIQFTRKHNEKHTRSFFAVWSDLFDRCGRKWVARTGVELGFSSGDTNEDRTKCALCQET